jgi:hypothetical protein
VTVKITAESEAEAELAAAWVREHTDAVEEESA